MVTPGKTYSKFWSNPFAPFRTPTGGMPRYKIDSQVTNLEAAVPGLSKRLYSGDEVIIDFDEIGIPKSLRYLDTAGRNLGALHSLRLRWDARDFHLEVNSNSADLRNAAAREKIPTEDYEKDDAVIFLRKDDFDKDVSHRVIIPRPCVTVNVNTYRAIRRSEICKKLNPFRIGQRVMRDAAFNAYLLWHGAYHLSRRAGSGGLEPFEERWIRGTIDAFRRQGKPTILQASLLKTIKDDDELNELKKLKELGKIERFNERLLGLMEQLPQVYGTVVWTMDAEPEERFQPAVFRYVRNPSFNPDLFK